MAYIWTAMLHNYNKGMGRVNLPDNAIQNFRINIRGNTIEFGSSECLEIALLDCENTNMSL
ncbi:hypothetical protein FF38_02973 [Lucilia cuprina]|uniref:Uncharacterized protein n=1 Tax=Lucilia cuprina TaxID=7375 RepID=A0A0L0BU61_LUCCU|nr:hypothetical protein CVS40_12933 [Lucilia cuprina]KNC23556.1 hypothetical protein FF38_02973 [Lucilia cuprina]